MRMCNRNRQIRITVSLLTVATVVFLGGCGGRSDIGEVSGTVTMGGSPLANARVIFQPQSAGVPSYGLTDSEGKYALQFDENTSGAIIGKHTVSISTFFAGDPDADPPQTNSPETVPPQYNANSELTAEVVAGSNTFDFTLEEGDPTDWQQVGANPEDE
jgi:hypothetical protein